MNNPVVSVIMSVYNDKKYVSVAIDSILNQSFKDFEFIIINDGSTDKTLEILNDYERKDSRIVLINQENKGLTKSLNIGIKKAKGKYIARMDSDDISHPQRLQKQIEFLENNQDYALLGCNVIKIDESSDELEKNKTKYSYEDIYKRFKYGNCIAHGSVMINKQLIGELLEYDENFKYSQDYRLWTKIAKKYKVANTYEHLYYLRLHDNSISKTKLEDQAIYAGIISYEFETDKVLTRLDTEISNNNYLRKKIGIALLMQFKPELAYKYFTFYSLYKYLSLFMKIIDLQRLKSWVK